jgi:hypothetical protein
VTRTGMIAWSVLGIIGSTFLLFCGAWVAIFAFALSIDAPHAWKGDIRVGLIYALIALALIVGGILLLRGSIRRCARCVPNRNCDKTPDLICLANMLSTPGKAGYRRVTHNRKLGSRKFRS